MHQHPPNPLLKTKDSFIGYGDTRYKFLNRIGQGTYGIVYSAVDTLTNQMVAIKKIGDVFKEVRRAVQLLREIKLLRLLRHPNIVEIKSIILPPSSGNFNDIYVVCELMDSNLDEAIRLNDDFTPVHHRYFMYQILCALKFMHAGNVYHLDLKPQNVLVNKRNCLTKVCDFGLSRVAFSQPSTAWTYTGYVGTKHYMAPEIWVSNHSRYPYAVDIWSIGCIFAELLTRKKLFPWTSVVNQLDLITDLLGTPSAEIISGIRNDVARKYLRNMRKKSPVSFAERFPNSDPLALQLLQKLLAYDPKDRPTAEEALADNYFRGLPETKSGPTQLIARDEFAFESCKSEMEIRELMYHEILQHHPQLLKDHQSEVPVYLAPLCYTPLYYDPAIGHFTIDHCGTSWLLVSFTRPMIGEAHNAISGNALSTPRPSIGEPTARLQPLHLPDACSSRNVTGEFIQNIVPLQQPLVPYEHSRTNVTGEFVQNPVPQQPPLLHPVPLQQPLLHPVPLQQPHLPYEHSSTNVTGEFVQNPVPQQPPLLHPVPLQKPLLHPVPLQQPHLPYEHSSTNVTGEFVQNPVPQQRPLLPYETSSRNVTRESFQNQVPQRPLFPSNASGSSMNVNQERSVTEEGDRESSLLRQLQDLNIKPSDHNKDKQCSGLGLPYESSTRNVTGESVRNQITPQPVFPSNASRTSMEVNQVNAVKEGNRGASLNSYQTLSRKPYDSKEDKQYRKTR